LEAEEHTPIEKASQNKLDLSRSRTPLATKDSSCKTLNGPALLMKIELGLKPDSGSLQQRTPPMILKGRDETPKQEFQSQSSTKQQRMVFV